MSGHKQLFVIFLLITAFQAPLALAAGKKKPSTPASGDLQATPTQHVWVEPVGTRSFTLPNGESVNLEVDLNELFITEVSRSQTFRPLIGEAVEDSCGRSLHIRAQVTNMNFDVGGTGLHFGYSSSGNWETGQTVDGEVKVKVGALSMDFRVLDCEGEACAVPMASSVDQKSVQTDLEFNVNLDEVHAGADFVFKTNLAKIFREMMQKGISKMEAMTERYHELPWSAEVNGVDLSQGVVVLNAGTREGLTEGTVFTVYSRLNESDSCGAELAVAEIKIIDAYPLSSTAEIERTTAPREVRAGDLVFVRKAR